MEKNRDTFEKTKVKIEDCEKNFDAVKKNKEESSEELKKVSSERAELKISIEENINKNEELKNAITFFEKEKIRLSERQESYKRDVEDRKERLKNSEEKLERNKEYFENLLKRKKR